MALGKNMEANKSSNHSTPSNGKDSSTSNGASKKNEDVVVEKKRNEQAESVLAAVNAGLAMIEFQPDGSISFANDNFINAMGYSEISELQGQHHRIFCTSEYAESPDYEQFWEDLNSGEIKEGEFRRLKADGEEIWLQATYTPVKDDNGVVQKVIKIATDVTARKSAFQEIKRVVEVVGQEGNLTVRPQLEGASGAELELLESVNQLLENVGIPVLQLRDAMKSLSEGDLSFELTVDAKGDIAEMAGAYDAAIGNLNSLLGNILENSSMLAAASEQMLTKSNQMEGTTDEVAAAIDEMAQGVQQQAQQIDESSKLMEEVRNSANAMGSKAEMINKAAVGGQESVKAGLSTVQQVVDSMTGIQSSAKVTSESINVLTERSEEIARTLNVITDIAAQTNLLALNAAIEAARAGDAGRGFAVVAEEIRKLAEDSRKSAGDIEKVINAVGKDIQSAGKAISDMDGSVTSGNQASIEAEEVFKKIETSTYETLSLSQEVLEATEMQKTSINGTVRNIEKIVVVSEETATGTEQIATSSRDLNEGMGEFNSTSQNLVDIADQLQAGVSKFKLSSKINY